MTPGSKVLDGGAILHKAWTIMWKTARKNTHKHMESLDPTIYWHNFRRLSNGLKSQRGWRAITRINGELIFSFGKLVGQEQTKVNKFIIPDFGFEFQWHPCIDWQIDGQEYVLRLECPDDGLSPANEE